MANPTTNYGFVLPTSTDLVTDLPADFDIALQGVDTRLKALQPGTTLGDIAYSSATANVNTRLGIGTNGQVLAVSGGVPAWTTTADVTPLTTKGDLFTFTTVDARLGVGTNGQVLQADSAEATGLKWATPSAGGGMTLLSTTSLSGATTTISSISQSYKSLLVLVIAMTNSTADGKFRVAWNTSNYFFASGTSNATAYSIDNSYLSPNVNTSRTETNNAFALEINNYTDGTYGMKPMQCYGFTGSASTSFNLGGTAYGTGALTSLAFSNTGGNWSGGTVLIYGVS